MSNAELIETYASLPPEAQQEVIELIARLRQRYLPPLRQSDVNDDAFVGMWSHREDLENSDSWVRETRKSEWNEGR